MPVENTLNDQQKAAVQYNGDAQNLLVITGAGCGKTRTIISRAAHLIKSGTDSSRILLVTFTNTESFIIYDESSLPCADDYIIDADYLMETCL